MNSLLIFLLFSTCTLLTVDCQPIGTDIPSFGLYWFDAANHKFKADAGSLNNLPSTAFNPTNTKTIIHFHGWCPGCALAKPSRFPSFNPSETFSNDLNASLAAPWVADGWNVGLYIWTPFADVAGTLNLIPIEAEVKINDASKTTYRYPNGTTSTSVLGQTMTDHAIANITNALSAWNGGQLVLSGHSLGANLLVHIVSKMVQTPNLPAKVKPSRVVLMDHFFFQLASEAPGMVTTIKQGGISMESYRASPIGAASNVKTGGGVDNQCIFTEIKPWHLTATDLLRKHEFAWNWFFQSYANPSPATYNYQCVSKLFGFCTGMGFVYVTDPTSTSPSARTPLSELNLKCSPSTSTCPYKWRALNDNFSGQKQGDGVCTQYESDDSMELINMSDPDLLDIGNCKCCTLDILGTAGANAANTTDFQSPNTATSSHASVITTMVAIIGAVLLA